MFGYHGFYEEERILGNYFILNVKVGIPADKEIIVVENSVNYEGLLFIVKSHFEQTRPLLEELVQSIAAAIKATYPHIEYVWVSVKKNNPPLGYEIESSEVSIEQCYKIG